MIGDVAAGQAGRGAARVADDADDLALAAGHADVQADDVLSLVEAAHELLVDDRHRRRVRPIGVGEGAPLADREAQRLDVAGRDVAHVGHARRCLCRIEPSTG